MKDKIHCWLGSCLNCFKSLYSELLHQIFECLYQADVITYEGFEQWEQSKDPAEQEGKGVAIKSTTQFFTWLREVDPDEET